MLKEKGLSLNGSKLDLVNRLIDAEESIISPKTTCSTTITGREPKSTYKTNQGEKEEKYNRVESENRDPLKSDDGIFGDSVENRKALILRVTPGVGKHTKIIANIVSRSLRENLYQTWIIFQKHDRSWYWSCSHRRFCPNKPFQKG